MTNTCCPHCEQPCPTWGNGHEVPCYKCEPWKRNIPHTVWWKTIDNGMYRVSCNCGWSATNGSQSILNDLARIHVEHEGRL